MALDDEAVRHTLLWLTEQQTIELERAQQYLFPFLVLCATCGHDRTDHVVGGDADNPSPWPCNFPHTRGAPAILCYCADYQPLTDDQAGYPGGGAT